MRGDGRLYTRSNSPYFWMSYCHDGKEIRESSEIEATEENRQKALKKLRARRDEIVGEKHGGKPFLAPAQRKLTVGDLLDALEEDYKKRDVASPQFRSHLKRIREDLGHYRASELTPEIIDRCVNEYKEVAKPATINNRLQLLSQAYSLAIERRHLTMAPHIATLEVQNARQGFFEQADFGAVVDHLPQYLQDFTRFAYMSGWRLGEITSLRWCDVEPDVIRLRPENSKNREGRSLPLRDERNELTQIGEIIERRRKARTIQIAGQGQQVAAYVFHHDGSAIGDFRKAWHSACAAAGMVGKLFHDLRRTAVRNMVRAGVPERVAMEISGHKTRSIFDRYNIVNERDKQLALSQTQLFLASGSKTRKIAVMTRKP